MALNKNDFASYITADEIQKMVRLLARQIENDYKDREVVLIAPLKGSLHFLADLTRELNLPQVVDFVLLSSTSKSGSVTITKDISVNISGKDVLIIEEIIDSGRKLNFLFKRIQASQPRSLKIVSLLDKPARREIPLSPDYVGRVIDDRFVLGYGMDTDELGRNLPDIYFLKN